MNRPIYPTYGAQVTDWVSTGDDLLGGTQLKMLLEGFSRIMPPDLEDLFPTMYTPERTIAFEQYFDSITMAPIVEMGKEFSLQLGTSRRSRKRYSNPVFTRQHLYVEDSAINDMRAPGTFNDRLNPAAVIAKKIEDAYRIQQELITFLRYSTLLGGINYTDARSNVAINVNTGIPLHNMFSYNGWGGTYANGTAVTNVAAGAAIPDIGDGNTYTANGNLNVSKGRMEALLFTDPNLNIGVPWTHRQADIAATVRRLKTWLTEVNKVSGWEIYMGGALYDAIQNNEIVRRSSGQLAFIGQMNVTAGGRTDLQPMDGPVSPANAYTFANGDLAAISGCKINVVRGRYPSPETGESELYWPPHQIVMVAPRGNTGDSLGMTWHCLGEMRDVVGPWIRSSENPPSPALPGTSIQMGDAFLPIAKYPHWISLINVCEPGSLNTGLYDDSLFAYGTSYSLY
jgi:hypothetical protein